MNMNLVRLKLKMLLPLSSLLLLLATTPAPSAGRRSFARYQRGDQGPDMSEAGGGGGDSGEDSGENEYAVGGGGSGGSSSSSGGSAFSRTDTLVPAPIGGPNVCRWVETILKPLVSFTLPFLSSFFLVQTMNNE